MVSRAPAIKCIGPEFLQPHNHRHHPSAQATAGFLTLHELSLVGLVEWEKWEWEQEVQSMPALVELFIGYCKLRCIPSGLATHARALKKLTILSVQQLQSIENFASVVELNLAGLPDLIRISNFPKLRKLEIGYCRKLKSLQGVDALQRLVLTVHYSESRLPLYLQTIKPTHLRLNCWPGILISIALGKSSSEWDKFSHIQHVEAYADDNGIEKRWHVFYTREPYNMETNLDLQALQDHVNFLQSWGEDGLPRLADQLQRSRAQEVEVAVTIEE